MSAFEIDELRAAVDPAVFARAANAKKREDLIYGLARADDGTWLPFNRDYRLFGTDRWWGDFVTATGFKFPLDLVEQVTSGGGHERWFYNDGTTPVSNWVKGPRKKEKKRYRELMRACEEALS